MMHQSVVAFQDTRVQLKNSSHKNHSITDYLMPQIQQHKHYTNITQIKIKKRIMVSIPIPQPYDVTEHVLHNYNCKSCNNNFSNDGNLSPTGIFDGVVIRNVVEQYSKKIPYDTIRKTLQE